jgi:bifunctional N-acetylglucosamine-1-phosphate-uridyltransferase/glucosamine-1-phosphate-acetyltransferase GlmU-like protein
VTKPRETDMHKTNVLILAASGKGRSQREYPGFLSEMDGECLLEKLCQQIHQIAHHSVCFAFLTEDVRKYRLASIAELVSPGASIVKVPSKTKGAACTALLAAANFGGDEELVLVSANEFIDQPLGDLVADFRAKEYDAATLVFQSVHPRYSYVKVDNGLVSEAAQCVPISRNATTGFFWFRKVSDFIEAIESAIRKDSHHQGHYYVAPLLNELLLKGRKVGALSIDSRHYLPLKSERQIAAFEDAHLQQAPA